MWLICCMTLRLRGSPGLARDADGVASKVGTRSKRVWSLLGRTGPRMTVPHPLQETGPDCQQVWLLAMVGCRS